VAERKSRKYLNGARDQACVLCGREDGTIVACHLPSWRIGFGAGTGQKAPDWLTADCCRICHSRLDQGDWRQDYEVRMKALCLTLERRFEQGLLKW